MMIGEQIHFIAQLSVERLLNGVLQGTVIALFAWLVLRVIGRRNSGTRFAVWFCALLAIAVAPFLESAAAGTHAILHRGAAITMPRAWSFYLFAAWAGIALIGVARVAVGLCHLRSIRRNCRPLIEAETAPKGAEDKPDLMASLKRCPETKLLGSIIDLELSDPHTGASHPPLTHPSRAWVGHPLELEASIARAIAESGRRIEVCVSDELRVPTALGLVKPAVVLPTWALRELSAAELNAVVLHEVAHLRRWDDWTNLAQKLLRAVFFFHPAVWWVESRLSLEREMACDDMVLAQTENPRAYAECLVSLAEKNLLQRGVALAQAAVGRMRQTTARVLQILDPRRTKTSGVWTPAPWVVAGFSVVCLLSAGHGPRLIAFGDPASASPAVMSATSPTAADDNASFVPLVVPAAYHETRSNSELAPQRTKAAKAGAAQAARTGVHNTSPRQIHVRTRAEIAIQAVHRTTGQQAVPLVHAAYTEDAPVVVMQQAVFVFIRDSRFGAAVPVIWRVSVWNFTVLPAAPSQAGRELPSKSI